MLPGSGAQGRGASTLRCRAPLQALLESGASSGVCACPRRALSALSVQLSEPTIASRIAEGLPCSCLRHPLAYTFVCSTSLKGYASSARDLMVLAPDMRASMRDAVVDAAASAEAGERFVQLVAEVGVRHWQLRSARLRLPALHNGLQPRFHRICKQRMLLGRFISISQFCIGLCCGIPKQHAAEGTRMRRGHCPDAGLSG